MSVQTLSTANDLILQRIYAEFLEMPGLRLTCEQARRFWGLDENTCRRLLDFLVEAKFLYRQGHGAYSRLTDGRAKPPRLRMAMAGSRDADAQTIEEAV